MICPFLIKDGKIDISYSTKNSKIYKLYTQQLHAVFLFIVQCMPIKSNKILMTRIDCYILFSVSNKCPLVDRGPAEIE